MEIFLVRHGIAQDPADAASDAERILTEEGFDKTARVARAFRKRVDKVDVIFHSRYVRAEQTARLFAREYPRARVSGVPGLVPHDPPRGALSLLASAGADEAVMLVGHEPFLSSLAGLLLNGTEKPLVAFRKAGIAGFDCLGPVTNCQLQFLLSPRWMIG